MDGQSSTNGYDRVCLSGNLIIDCKLHDKTALQQGTTNIMSYENVLYFAISRDLDNKDQIYGKFGNHKVGPENEKKRFAAYNTVNPSYKYMAVQYNKMIMGTKNQYLDNYINQTVLFKSSTKPLVNFKKSKGESNRYTDWFCLTEHSAKNILLYMEQLNDTKPYNKPVPLDNEYDYTIFVRAICSYLQLRDERLNVYFSCIPTHHKSVLPKLDAVSSKLQAHTQKKNRMCFCL